MKGVLAGAGGRRAQALALLDGLAPGAVPGDRARDSDAILTWMAPQGAVPAVAPATGRRTRSVPSPR